MDEQHRKPSADEDPTRASDRATAGAAATGARIPARIGNYEIGAGWRGAAWATSTRRSRQNSPPADETLVTDVYAQVTPQLQEQLAAVLALEGRSVNAGAFPL